MMARPNWTVDAASLQLRDRLALELRYRQTWLPINLLQRAVATALAEGTEKLDSETVRALLAARMGLDGYTAPPTIAAVQSALRRLAAARIADRWVIDDPEFAAWLRERIGKDGRV